MASLAEIYVQRVSTSKVKTVTEELCYHTFSTSTISTVNKHLHEIFAAFAPPPLEEPFSYLILHTRYEKVREAPIVHSLAALIAVRIYRDTPRQVLAF